MTELVLTFPDGDVTQKALRRAVVAHLQARDGDRCFYCGAAYDAGLYQVDHVRPSRYGGKDNIDNFVLACARCNTFKGAAPAWLFVIAQELGLERVPRWMSHRDPLGLLAPRADPAAGDFYVRGDWLDEVFAWCGKESAA